MKRLVASSLVLLLPLLGFGKPRPPAPIQETPAKIPSAAAAVGVAAMDRLQLMNVFKIGYVSDPQVSPDGKQVVYVRNFMDVMKDKPRSHLWIINAVASIGPERRPGESGAQGQAVTEAGNHGSFSHGVRP